MLADYKAFTTSNQVISGQKLKTFLKSKSILA